MRDSLTDWTKETISRKYLLHVPQNVEDGSVRLVRIHDGAAEMVPVEDANAEGIVIEEDRLSAHTVVVSNTSTLAFESNGGSAV